MLHRHSQYRSAPRFFIALLCISCCAYALPRVPLPDFKARLPASKIQAYYKIRNTEDSDPAFSDEVSHIEFDLPSQSTSKRPNVCSDCVCGVGRTTRIIGGNFTNIYEYPWLVSMFKVDTFYCAGSLITRKHVLTAAHCLKGFDPKYIKLILSDNNNSRGSSNAIVRTIKSAILHENYHSYTYNNDIAIIEMDRPVSVNGPTRTACLPEDKAIDYTGAMATVVGWGQTGETVPVSDELRKVDLPILSQEECDEAGYSKNRITQNMFCAGYLEGHRDACFGDSGGPLHVKGSAGQLDVIGIISWGRGCGRPNFPGIYTRLTNYLGWLKDHLGGECVCPPPQSQ